MEQNRFSVADLSTNDILNNLNHSFVSDVFVFESINSTNAYCKELAANGAKHGTVVIADHQTQGRGRLGRDFFSPAGSGLYMSILFRTENLSESNPTTLTIAAGVAVCRAIESLTDKNPQIKWVNDIFLDGKKICGILAEGGTSSSGSQLDYVIVGIGLNISTNSFPGKLREIAGSLFPQNITRSQFASEILNNMFALCKEDNSGSILSEYKHRSLVLGKKISFTKNSETYCGTAIDINNEGNLIVKLGSGNLVTLNSGEISIGSSSFASSD